MVAPETSSTNNSDLPGGKVLKIMRSFDAAPEKIFRAFAHPGAVSAWWGARDALTFVAGLDFKPGGAFHYRFGETGHFLWGKFVYIKIEEPFLLEFISSYSDEKKSLTRAPFSALWPLEVYNRIELQEAGNKTRLKISMLPVRASLEEGATFRNAHDIIRAGFGATLSRLGDYLASGADASDSLFHAS